MQTMSTVKKSIITAVCIALCYVLPLLFNFHCCLSHESFPPI